MQFADGTSPITYTVTGSITGRRVSMTSYTIKALVPEWTVTPDPLSSTNIRTGKITSINSAKSKMGVYYGERELARSTNEIAFAKVDLKIYAGTNMSGFENISSSNNTLIVGEQINLKAVIDVTNLASQATYQWVLPNDAISYYDENATSNPVKRLDSNQLSSNAITFYLTASNSAAPITCNVTINGSQFALSNSLNVVKPNVNLSATINSNPNAGVHVDQVYGFYALRFGYFLNPYLYGIRFDRSHIIEPVGFETADLCYTQIIQSSIENNNTVISNSLDNRFIYAAISYAADSPRTPLNVSTTDIFNPTRSPFTANDNFLMYVMYKPKLPNSCYVPLVNVSWSWGGTAEANLLHSSWTLKSSHSSTSGTGIETDSPPNWSSIYTNGNLITNRAKTNYF
jgi:hypothetical protein